MRPIFLLEITQRCSLFLLAGFAQASQTDPPIKASQPIAITTAADQADYWPCFSADGRKVIFCRRSANQAYQLFQVPADGGEATPLFEKPLPTPATRVSRSRSGRLAFAGAGAIWITDSDGTHPRKIPITGLTGNPSYPTWYPDEKQVLVVAYQGEKGGVLNRIDIDSGQVTPVSDPSKVFAGMANLSADGKKIVFAGQSNHGQVYDQSQNSIWVILDQEDAKPLIQHQGRAATWSPSGDWIAYESNEGSPDRRYAIFIASADGKIDQRISSYELEGNHPVWSPDGRSLAFSIRRNGRPGQTSIATVHLDFKN